MAEAEQEPMGMPKPGEFCWTEIATNDLKQAKDFYANVFGWTYGGGDVDGMEYPEFSAPSGEYPMGGMYAITKEMFGEHMPPPHFLNYIAVDDVDASFAKSKELGASSIKEPMDIPNVGRFCIISDPTGGMVSLFKMGDYQPS